LNDQTNNGDTKCKKSPEASYDDKIHTSVCTFVSRYDYTNGLSNLTKGGTNAGNFHNHHFQGEASPITSLSHSYHYIMTKMWHLKIIFRKRPSVSFCSLKVQLFHSRNTFTCSFIIRTMIHPKLENSTCPPLKFSMENSKFQKNWTKNNFFLFKIEWVCHSYCNFFWI
jgi:hypothetical protein